MLEEHKKYYIGDIVTIWDSAYSNGELYYFLVEDISDDVYGYTYAYRCLNDNTTGKGSLQHPNTQKVA